MQKLHGTVTVLALVRGPMESGSPLKRERAKKDSFFYHAHGTISHAMQNGNPTKGIEILFRTFFYGLFWLTLWATRAKAW
jgi:hypothetical protein